MPSSREGERTLPSSQNKDPIQFKDLFGFEGLLLLRSWFAYSYLFYKPIYMRLPIPYLGSVLHSVAGNVINILSENIYLSDQINA